MVDTPRLWLLVGLLVWAGAALVLSELRWFSRASLADRLLPFASTRAHSQRRALAGALVPFATATGDKLTKLLGVNDDLATRLQRAHMTDDVASFRTRQIGWASACLALALLAAIAIRPPLPLALLFIAGAPVLAFLVLEQQVATAIEKRKQRLFVELPVVSEQLATLLGAGYSLGSALVRLAERNSGVTGEDLRIVSDRMQQGLTTTQALQEWAQRADVPELHRLVAVLALSSETSDLGRLVSEEAKGIRREAQRRLAEVIDRRSQQVWVPVTVATLIPGVTFLIIPFLQALQLFSNS